MSEISIPGSIEQLAHEAIRPPLVSCLMVTGKQRASKEAREKLVMGSIASFKEQTYTPRELIIINDAEPLPSISESSLGAAIHLHQVQPGMKLGQLRNLSLMNAHGEWLCHWDDDDYSHPHRLAFQMAARREGHCVLLKYQIRFNTLGGQAVVFSDTLGHSSTLLFPKTDARYPDLIEGDDAIFWTRAFRGRAISLENSASWYPGPALHIKFCHGQNVQPMERLLGAWNGPEHNLKWVLDENNRFYLTEVLKKYGVAAPPA